jgi:PPOX class probable F420-dependent enzyme
LATKSENTLDPGVVELARGPNYAAFTTLMEDGRPQTRIVWVGTDGEHILVNTQKNHKKFENVRRDPRISVAIWDARNPYHYAEVRGEVVETVFGDEARRHIDELSLKYHGMPYGRKIESERVMLRVEAHRQIVNAPVFG